MIRPIIYCSHTIPDNKGKMCYNWQCLRRMTQTEYNAVKINRIRYAAKDYSAEGCKVEVEHLKKI